MSVAEERLKAALTQGKRREEAHNNLAEKYQVERRKTLSLEKKNQELRSQNRKLLRRLEGASGHDNRHKGSRKFVRRAGNRNSASEQADKDFAMLTATDTFRSAYPENDQPAGQGPCMGRSIRAVRDGKPTHRAEKLPDRRSKRSAQ